MKRFALMAAIAAATSLSAAADTSIEWLSKVYDFGAFEEENEKCAATFRFVNTGDEPVAITSAKATCGCTVPRYSTDPIAPGDTATIDVTYDPAGRPGRFEKQLYVRTTADHERYRLVLKGVVVGSAETIKARYPVDMGPLKLRNGAAMMGRVLTNHAKMAYVDGYNRSQDSISPVVEGLPEYVEVTTVPKIVPPGEQVQFNFYFRGDRCKEYGIVTDSATVAPYPGSERYTLPIVAIVEEDFSRMTPGERMKAPLAALESDRIVLGQGINAPVTGKAKLTNRGQSTLKVRRVYTQDPGITVSVASDSVKKGKSTNIIVSADPAKIEGGLINARVTIITNDPDNPTQTLRVVGEK